LDVVVKLELTMGLSAGSQLGRYSILSELGKGGMGEVYRAIDTSLNRNVAIKVLPEHMVKDPDALRRFEREAKALAALSHPSILTIFDVGNDQGISYVVMELLEGKTLREHFKASHLSYQEKIRIAVMIVEGLSAAHSKGVVHRDLKPENIFVTSNGKIKILDFGLARVTAFLPSQGLTDAPTRPQEVESITVSGTVPYMSPEQISGKSVDSRSDIFSFGCVLYEMLTGSRPFSRDSQAETIAAILKENPPPLCEKAKDIPQELERIVLHCLEKNPGDRFQSTNDLMFALNHLSDDSAILKSTAPMERVRSHSMNTRAVITILAVLAAIVCIYLFTRPEKAIDSLAILPFVNVSGNPDMEYLGDGITESLINNLSQLPSLRVMARTTVFTYKGRSVDPRQVGQEMNVRAVLTGKLNRIGDTLVIQGELVDASDGSQLWGDQYSEKFTDILTLQGTISKQIAEKLRHKLTGEEEKLLTKQYTANADAYQLYLKGLYFGNKRSPEGLLKSMEYYQQAIDIDPNYALAYAGLAVSTSSQVMVSDAAPKECFPKAKEAALKALQIDDSLPEAHAIMIYAKSHYDWDWPGTEREFKRTMQLNSNLPQAHAWYAGYLAKMKRHNEAIAEIKRAQELDPLSLYFNLLVGLGYYRARQYDQALEQYKKTLEMDPTYYPIRIRLAEVYREKGMYQQALDELSKGNEASGHYSESLAMTGYIYAITGRHEEAQKMIDKLKDRSSHRYVSPYHIAVVYSGLGEKDLAFEWLEKAYLDRSMLLSFINITPLFDNLRSDPRFANLLQKLKLTT
jgi:serine/threonine-protein kinase